MITKNSARIMATLLLGAAVFSPAPLWAGSCCGGGGGSALILPSFYRNMVDLSYDWEQYDGYWKLDGTYVHEPVGGQYRLNVGYAHRLAQRWQTSISVPYVWNDNQYGNGSTQSSGLGDTTANLWYEALEDKSAWKIRTWKDLLPSITIGPALLIPTGISPYDDKLSSFETTGRGFYRVDGNLLIAKTLHPWTASLSLAYGTNIERPVNREYDKDVKPYQKKLGDRSSVSTSLGYIYYLGSAGDTLTGTVSFSALWEEDATIDGHPQESSGFRKEAVGAGIAYSSTDRDWVIRGAWSHAVRKDGWGESFPTTDIFTLGVNYGFR